MPAQRTPESWKKNDIGRSSECIAEVDERSPVTRSGHEPKRRNDSGIEH